jgi:hypothetical protein
VQVLLLLLLVGGAHEREDDVEGYRAEEGEAVDVSEVDLAREEENGAEEEEEEEGTGEVGIVHEVLVDVAEGVEDGESLRMAIS